ncbi:hypothetical protein [Halorubrum ezzemoulense]|uniref:Uncharacterized protein n=1 Tax=Halorubrum ezzemoulense TaxID=337243 RepID=A0A256K0B0_HALEZ|nr:hypothetical protein [Halorubrum ezzemoulense]OYR74594.1 hypothetical protein DJ84_24265 [Halorubrum ezzemoulense]QAY19126.1 hypothetical protein EO776_03565 [Halorubrum ezzemoulense]
MSRKRSRDRSRGGSSGIISRRGVIAALAVGGIGAAALESTGAFSAVDSRRDVSVVSTDDDEAFMRITGGQVSGSDGDTVTLFGLTNQFDQPLTSVSATVVSSGNPIDPGTVQTPDRLSPGGSGDVRAALNCGTDGAVKLRIVAASANQRVEFTRTAQVTCESVDVCAPRRLPAGCTVNEVPNNSTDCSVVIDTPNQIKEQITGNTTIGGAAEFHSKSQIDLTLRGNSEIRKYLKVKTPSQIGLDFGGNSRVQGGVKIRSKSQLDFGVSTHVEGGICVEDAGEVKLTPSNATIDGEVSLTSNDQVTVDSLKNATTGPITIDASGQVKFDKTRNSTVNGPVSVTAAGQVKLDKLEAVSTGSITVDAKGQVDIVSERDSTVDGAIEITDAGGQITLDLAATEISEGVSLANKSQVKMSQTDGSTIGSAVDIDTESQVEVDLTGSSIEDDLDIKTKSQVKIDLTDSQVDGTVTIETQSQVDVILNNSSVTGDLSISTPSQITVSDCSAVEGEVSPRKACQ